jgi:hypothetical protein
MLEEAHRIHRDRSTHPDRYADAILICTFARVMALRDLPTTAIRLLACFEALLDEVGSTAETWVTRMNDETLAIIGDRLDGAAVAEERQRGRRLTADETVLLASAS